MRHAEVEEVVVDRETACCWRDGDDEGENYAVDEAEDVEDVDGDVVVGFAVDVVVVAAAVGLGLVQGCWAVNLAVLVGSCLGSAVRTPRSRRTGSPTPRGTRRSMSRSSYMTMTQTG